MQAALENTETIIEVLEGANMVFITAGMGGGTGTGASQVIANHASSMGILTVAIVTRPFEFEGGNRMQVAEDGIKSLVESVDAIIVIPNQKLFELEDVDILCLSCMTATVQRGKEIARQYKEIRKQKGSPSRTIIGGIHASMIPDDVIDDFDQVFVGEAETKKRGVKWGLGPKTTATW